MFVIIQLRHDGHSSKGQSPLPWHRLDAGLFDLKKKKKKKGQSDGFFEVGPDWRPPIRFGKEIE